MMKKLGIAALALALTLGLGLTLTGRDTTAATGLAAVAQTAADAQEAPVIEDMVLGNPDAKVTLTEYASYTCPHCANFHASVFKDLKKNYIDTGKVKFVYREVYFDRYGLWAAMVARCDGSPQRYFGIQNMVYDQQRQWSGSDDPTTVVNNLKKIGRTAGLDDAQLDACLQDGAKAQAMVATYQKNAEADGVNATPTLFINGKKHSNMTYADLSKLLDEALAE